MMAAAFAAELGIVAAIDPLDRDPLEDGIPDPTEVAYARITGMGRRTRRVATDDLERLTSWAEPSDRAFIVFATPTRYQDAIALSRTLGLAER